MTDRTPWEETLAEYDGVQGVIDMIRIEGLAHFVHDFIGAQAFEGGPLEDAARKLDEAMTEFIEGLLGI